jgi:hypothetical protein
MAKAFEIIADPILRREHLESGDIPGTTKYIVVAETMQEAIDKTEKVIASWNNAGHEDYRIKKVTLLGEGANVVT